MNNGLYLGIDIGTTNIGFSLSKEHNAEQLCAYSIPNGCDIKSSYSFEHIQDAELILQKIQKELYSLLGKYGSFSAIGLSTQMHGMLYLDSEGNAVSKLFTWQDERGNEIYKNGVSYAHHIKETTGCDAKSGYGLVTHFYNLANRLVPQNAVTFCSVGDYIGMKLCKLKRPVIHTSVAASFGLFDPKNLCFDLTAAKKLGISPDFLPQITNENKIIGFYKETAVCVCIGDNQASFLGSVEKDTDMLLNFGTGSQISFVNTYRENLGSCELRPYTGGKFLVCGASLCGGRAYAILENFFSNYMSQAGVKRESQYETLNRLALEELEKDSVNLPIFDTRFCGTRSNHDLSASITNLTEENFTPSKLIASLLYGMVNELYQMYTDAQRPAFSTLYASGGGVRKNKALQIIIEKVFGKEPVLPEIREEAAYGCAKFAHLCK